VKHVFIVGCPRSGSTWATFLLAHHPEVATFQHAKVFHYLQAMQRWHRNKSGYSFIVEPSLDDAPDAKRDANLKLAQALPEAELYPLLRPVAEGILASVAAARPGASVVVDKTPENGHLAEFILKVLPDAYFLHIARDPRSVFCSHRSASRSWAKWEFPTQPIDGARFWNDDVAAALSIEAMTDRYLQVRYEDLKDNGPTELARILSWLDLPAQPEFCEAAVAASSKDKVRPTKELPAGFVPGHPIAGTENSGVEASFAELYNSRRIILTPLPGTAPEALDKVTRMWRLCGAEVTEMSVEHHDEVLAATSHLPHMLAFSLVDTLARMQGNDEIFRYAAGGFRDFTRIASSNPVMWRDVCVANRQALGEVMDRYIQEMSALAATIKQGDGE
jgi:hypothetical protein